MPNGRGVLAQVLRVGVDATVHVLAIVDPVQLKRLLARAYGLEADIGIRDESGQPVTYLRIASELADRMISIFTRGPDGRRPLYGDNATFQTDPHWRDLILFHEYFDGDTGVGLGASHQTGWTGLVASLINEWRRPLFPSSR